MKKFLVDSEYLRDSVLSLRPPRSFGAVAKIVGVADSTLFKCMWKPPAHVSQRTAAKLRQAFGDRAIVVEHGAPPKKNIAACH